MTVRPEPVTSKFRNYYLKDILPMYYNSTFPISDSSSAGSTASLTSILNHKIYPDNDKNSMKHDSFNDLSTDSNDISDSKFPQKSLNRLNSINSNNLASKRILKSRKSNGVFREIINSADNKKFNEPKIQNYKPSEKSCKRIIARKPDYPGSRITHVNYKETICERNIPKPNKFTNNVHKNPAHKSNESQRENDKLTVDEKSNKEKPIPRTTCKMKTKNDDNSKDASLKNESEKSDVVYSVCDFTSVSTDSMKNIEKSEDHNLDDNNLSSTDEINSITIDEGSSTSIINSISNKPPPRILTAWEDWYLRKEKEERKLLENQRKKLLSEEEKKKEELLNKEKRREVCQKKITEWLSKKEKERLKNITKLNEEKKKKELKELEKDDVLKKSSKKYTAWKLKKLELQKEMEKQEKEKRIKIEADKMIKVAKAQTAFKHWLDEHKDYHLTVPYSYGISDGKLTSYYDKTSNPPPAYFNPKPWVPIIETKN